MSDEPNKDGNDPGYPNDSSEDKLCHWIVRNWLSLLLFGLIFALWLLWPSLAFVITGRSFKSPGEFGDLFGGLNALFTGLALVLIVVSIRQQQEEFKAWREESDAQAKNLESQILLANETHRVEREAQILRADPLFDFTDAIAQIRVENLGEFIRNVTISTPPWVIKEHSDLVPLYVPLWKRDTLIELDIALDRFDHDALSRPGEIVISYENILGMRREQSFMMISGVMVRKDPYKVCPESIEVNE